MALNNKDESCFDSDDTQSSCCKVESVVSIDERGQMVLPKEIREKAKIKAGDKLAILTWNIGGKVTCISLINANEFGGMLKEMLGPMMKEIIKS